MSFQKLCLDPKFYFRVLTLASFCAVLVSAAGAQGYLYGQASLQTGNKPGSFAVADFNGDGRPDVAIANEGDNTVSIVLANADGTFAPKVDYPVGSTPLQLVAADFNADGKMDLAVVNSKDNTVSILLGAGDGTFHTQVTYPTGAMPVAITSADFNGDKKPDLAVANQTDGTISIFFGNGDGTFTAQTAPVTVGKTPFAILASDMNGDGKPDLLVLNGTIDSNASLSLLINPGTGSFGPASDLLGGSLDTMAVGDINHDGIPDIVVTLYTTDQIGILLGSGNGTFRAMAVDASNNLGAGPQALALGDFDHDGNIDIAVAEYYSVAIYKGNGDGTFQAPSRCGIASTTLLPMMAAGDFNNDGLLDLALLIQDDNVVVVLLGNGDGTLANHRDLTLPASGGMAAAVVTDLNADGNQDVAIAQYNQPSQGPIQGFITSLLGNGSAQFPIAISSPTSDIGINGMVAADFNGDGKGDLATASVDADGGVAVFLGKGDGTFSPPISSFTGMTGLNLGPMVAGDFNRDGKSDLIVVSEDASATNSSPMYTLLSQGDGTFKESLLYNLPYGSVPSLAVADLNNDGYLDLAVGVQNELFVFLGHGDGTFAAPVSYSTNFNVANSVVIADFNRDGKLDIVVGCPRTILFFAGKGDGTFAAPLTSSVLPNNIQLVAGDFNGDGILDLAVEGPGLSDSVVLGNGDGTFQSLVPFQGTYYPRIFATGDLNADGTIDLLQFSSFNTLAGTQQALTIWSSTPVLSFSSSALEFGPQSVGTTSSPLPLSFSNVGNAPLALAGVTASGDFAETNTCAKTLDVGQGCTVDVTFAPTTNGAHTGSLIVTDNATTGTQTIILTGSTTSPPSPDFAISATPGSNTVQPGASTTYSVTLTPVNGFVGAVQLTCTGAPSEATCSPSAASTTLDGTNSAVVKVTVSTTRPSLVPLPPGSPIRFWNSFGRLAFTPVLCLILLCLLAVFALTSRAHTFRFAAAVFLLLAMTLATGCGGGNSGGGPSNPGTPSGTYMLTLTASSGSASHATTVTLIVD